MAKTYDPTSIRYVGQLRFSACEAGSTLTCQLYRADVEAIVGVEATDALVAAHEAQVEARRAPAPTTARKGSSYGNYGRTGGYQRTAKGEWAREGAEWTWGKR